MLASDMHSISIRSSPEPPAAVASPESSVSNNTNNSLPLLQDGAEQDVATSVVGLVGESHASLAQASDDMPSPTLPSPETSGDDDISPIVGSSSNKFPEALAQVAEGQEPKDKHTALLSPDSTKDQNDDGIRILENRWDAHRSELADILATLPAPRALQQAAPADDSIPAIAGSPASLRPVEPRGYFAPRQPLLRLDNRAQDVSWPSVEHAASKAAPLRNIPLGAAVPVVDVSGLKDSLKSTDVGPYMRDSHVPDASKHRELYSGRSHNDKLQLRRVDIDDLREQSKRLLSADDCILCAMGWTVKCSGDLCYLCASERDLATTEGGPSQSRVSVPVGDNIEPGAKRPADISDPETIPDSRLASPELAVAGVSKEALAMTDHDLQEANLRVLLDVGNVEYRHNERELQAQEEAKARNKKIENTIKEQNRASGMKVGKPPSLPGYIDNAPSKKRKSRM